MTDPSEARARFQRVILPRVEKALHAIALIGNGASRDYEATPDEVRKLLGALQDALDAVDARYTERFGGVEPGGPCGDPPPATTAMPAVSADPDFAAALRAVQAMKWGQTGQLAAAVEPPLIAPLVTHLTARLFDMAEGRRDG